MMSEVFEETIDEIEQGIWGDDFKNILNNEPFVAPDIEKELFVCRTCGKWNVEKNMNLYVPNNPGSILHKQYGDKTVEERGQVPCVMRWQLKEEYHLVKRRIHYCECGKRMHKATESEMLSLSCPYCGTINLANRKVLWD